LERTIILASLYRYW